MKYVVSYIKSMAFTFIILLGLAAITSADTTAPTITSLKVGINCLCNLVITLMPAICLLLIMAAGVIYAGGQVAGAETRAKAQGWATAMVIGAVIGLIMSILLPSFLKAVYSNSLDPAFCTGTATISGCPTS